MFFSRLLVGSVLSCSTVPFFGFRQVAEARQEGLVLAAQRVFI